MEKVKKNKNFLLKLVLIVALLSVLIMPLFTTYSNTTYAEDGLQDKYTNVLDDLKKDKNFDIDNFPEIENDYSVKVVQVAENSDNDLFVYTY